MTGLSVNQRLAEIASQPDCVLGMDLHGELVTGGAWLAEVRSLSQTFHTFAKPTVRIHSEDSLQFLKFFLAACIAEKQPVLLPNQQPETIASLDKDHPLCWDDQSQSLQKLEPPASDLQTWISNLPCLNSSAMLLFTSGTTGEPKQVHKSIEHFLNEVEILEKTFALPQNITLLATVSHHHVYGKLFRMWWPFLTGRKVVSKTIDYPEQISTLNSGEDGLCLVTTPSFLKRLDQPSSSHLGAVRCSFSSGGPLPAEASLNVGRWLGRFPIEVYGSTESGGIAFRQGTSLGPSSWKFFAGVSGTTDPEGRLSVTSPFFAEAELPMGDRIQWVSDTEFHLLGRVDRISKIEETRVSLSEMEAFFSEHSWVESAVVLPSTSGRQEIWAVVQLNPHGQQGLKDNGRFFSRQVFRKHLQHRFPPVVLPRRIRYVDDWPLTSRGKLDSKYLQELFKD